MLDLDREIPTSRSGIITELWAIQRELAEMPATDPVRRAELRRRRQALHAAAARLTAAEPLDDPEALRRRLARLHEQRDAIQAKRIAPSAYGLGGGAGGGGFDPVRVAQMNRAIATSQGLEAVDREIADTLRRLEALEGGS